MKQRASGLVVAVLGSGLALASLVACSGSDEPSAPAGGINGPARVDPDFGSVDND